MSEDKYDWDVLVLGGGTAGIVASRTAAALGARTALVERARTGGDCLWTGCVPSKALLAAARRAVDARTAPALGVRTGEVAVDFAAVMNHVRAAIKAIEPDDSPETLRTAGVHVVTGEARFVGADTCAVAGGAVRFRHAVIATGGRPVVPAVPGLADARPLTSETVWDLDVLPERLVVLGAGSVGCELGQAFARLGSRVTLVEALPRILPAEDPEASETVLSSLRHDGVRVLTGSRATGCRAGPDGSGELVVSTGEPASTGQGLAFDRILMAVGRRPGTADLAPDRAGVELDEDGFVRVDRRLRTTNPRVWAAGDVTAISAFTHTAGVHAGVAAGNAVLGLRRSVDLDAEPRVTFTDPEVAAVGAATWPSVDGEEPRTLTVHHTEVDRAVHRPADRRFQPGHPRAEVEGHRGDRGRPTRRRVARRAHAGGPQGNARR